MYVTHHRAAWTARLVAIAAFASAFGMRAEGATNPAELQAELDSIRGQQGRLIARSDQVLRQADGEGRALTDDERRAIARRTAEVETLDVRAQAIEEKLSLPQPRRTTPDAADPVRAMRAPAGGGGIGRAAVLASFPRGGDGGFDDFGAFARAVAVRDPRLFAQASPAGMQTGVGADGGFAIPPAQLNDLMVASLEQEVVRPRAMFIPMPSGSVTLPRFNDRDRSTGHAGLTGRSTAEGATGTPQKPKLEPLELKAGKLMVLVPTTNELLQDAGPVFSTLLSAHMAQAMAAKVDDLLLLGGGAGEALGLVNAPATIEVAKESGQAAASIVPQNLAKMVARLAPGSFNRAVWLCHSSVVAQLFLLQQTVKNLAGTENVGGSTVGWFTIAADGSMVLLGRPLIPTDRLPALGSAGDIMLTDLSQYMVGQVGEARLGVSQDAGFAEDETWFRLVLRIDGQPILPGPITPRRGSDTLSPFVKLAERT